MQLKEKKNLMDTEKWRVFGISINEKERKKSLLKQLKTSFKQYAKYI